MAVSASAVARSAFALSSSASSRDLSAFNSAAASLPCSSSICATWASDARQRARRPRPYPCSPLPRLGQAGMLSLDGVFEQVQMTTMFGG